MLKDLCITLIYTIIIPTNADKYTKIGWCTQWTWVHGVDQPILVYLPAFVGIIILYIQIM